MIPGHQCWPEIILMMCMHTAIYIHNSFLSVLYNIHQKTVAKNRRDNIIAIFSKIDTSTLYAITGGGEMARNDWRNLVSWHLVYDI